MGVGGLLLYLSEGRRGVRGLLSWPFNLFPYFPTLLYSLQYRGPLGYLPTVVHGGLRPVHGEGDCECQGGKEQAEGKELAITL